MAEARDEATGELVVTRERPVVARWQVGFLTALGLLLLITLVTGPWQTALAAGLAISSQLFVIVGRAERVTLDAAGITLRGVVRAEHVAWDEVEAITIDWRWKRELFDLELEDGSARSLRAVAGLARDDRAMERERFVERLRTAGERAGVDLAIHAPRRGVPR